MKTIIIQITNEWIFLSVDYGVPISSTNIPYQYLHLSESKEHFWEAKMKSFDKEIFSLHLEVINYYPKSIDAFENQTPKYKIKALIFEPFHWTQLQKILDTYQKKHLRKIITSTEPKKEGPVFVDKKDKIPLKAISFHLGYITINKSYPWDKSGELKRIDLPDSIPEYNFIKAYFFKIIGKKTIDVVYEVAIDGNNMHVSNVKSADLRKINRASVRVLKIGQMNHWLSKKPKYKPDDQDLFTFEEALACYGDEDFGNVDVFEKDLLFHIMEKETVRNRHQLKYLSAVLQDEQETLLLTLVPQFGFVFTYKGEEMNHFVWELLNSHATYIWSMPHSTNSIPLLEKEIKTICAQGRSEYRRHFENSEDLFFNVLIHKTKGASYEEYFERWKLNLLNLMV